MKFNASLVKSPVLQRYFNSQSSKALDLIKKREGLILKVYKDSLGKLTAGYGHLIKPGEEALGITQTLSDRWLKEDYQGAYRAAQEQAATLPLWTQELEDVLISVNYQLGIKWTSKFPKTWAMMVEGKYEEAAREVEDSLWHKQTPVRVRDLQRALWRASLVKEFVSLD
jgi:GH24 family phage-related lysozyme (muramidase)